MFIERSTASSQSYQAKVLVKYQAIKNHIPGRSTNQGLENGPIKPWSWVITVCILHSAHPLAQTMARVYCALCIMPGVIIALNSSCTSDVVGYQSWYLDIVCNLNNDCE